MSMEFEVIYTRYAATKGREISTTDFISATDFYGAAILAIRLARAMQEADPSRKYDVVSIIARGYTGERAEVGKATIWGDPFPTEVKA